MFSPYLKNGVVVQVAAASEYPNLESFSRAIVVLPLDFRVAPVPHVTFHSLRGRKLEFTYGEPPKRDGALVDYKKWPLFGGPFLEAAVDSEQLLLKHGSTRRKLDFRTLTIADFEEPAR